EETNEGDNYAFVIFSPPSPAPTLTSISPATVTAGGAGFILTATGSSFVETSVLHIDGAARQTTFVSATTLTATMLPSDYATAGTHAITVITPAPGGGTSSAATLTVLGPTITLAASSVTAGGVISAT